MPPLHPAGGMVSGRHGGRSRISGHRPSCNGMTLRTSLLYQVLCRQLSMTSVAAHN